MITDLYPEVQDRVNAAFEELHEKKIPFVCTSDFRESWRQLILFMQGRYDLSLINRWRRIYEQRLLSASENKYTVTECDGVDLKSNHQGRKAVDVVPAVNGKAVWPPKDDPRWVQISEVMKKHGFSWGGDWSHPDYPHYEYLGGGL